MLGIIPAAGSAKRFNGKYKEFLRLHNGAYLLDNAFLTLDHFGASNYILISNAEKIHKHATHLELFARKYIPHTKIMLQQDYTDMWQAIRLTLPYNDVYNMLVLPDTYWTAPHVDHSMLYQDIIFGIFTTYTPERFSVIFKDTIVTKSEELQDTGVYSAWGAVIWSDYVTDFWLKQESLLGAYATYDDAFRDAIHQFGYSTFPINQYYDFASQEAYDQFLTNNH